ncbi:RNA 2',3'-cyclic phosphodiesterase [Caenimonas terrae]|uniref:RNA 2',3'-cyclic phosphodiesterase n=1 Tax=Caenimonas terrae TaxID=696074 RepID=A0ABW0NAI7_9BURK
MAIPAPAPRLFLALWPDDASRQALAQWRDHWTLPAGAAPTRTENLHLTLHFLGPVAADRRDALIAALAERPATEPFTLTFGIAQLWPGGIAVVCPLAAPAPLERLHARLADVLRRLGLPVEERPFRPHVTLARKAARAEVPAQGPAMEWKVDGGFALVESAAGQGYRALRRFN